MQQTTRSRTGRLVFLLSLFLFGIGCQPIYPEVEPLSTRVINLPTAASTAYVTLSDDSNEQRIETVQNQVELPATNTPRPTATRDEATPLATRVATLMPTSAVTATPRPSATPILFPTATPEAVIEEETPTRTPRPGPTLAPDDPAFVGRSIDELTDRINGIGGPVYGMGGITVTEQISVTAAYATYHFVYDSDGIPVEGFVNIPFDGPEKKPIAIVLHGYVPPEQYELLDYTAEYANSLGANGYVTFHPSYRHHPPDPDNPPEYNTFRVDYAVDILNLVAHLRRESWDRDSMFWAADTNYVHLMGHSMGGGIALRVMTVWPDAFDAAVLYAPMSGDERLNYERISYWRGDRTYLKEVQAPDEVLDAVSPETYYDRLTVPISIHHGTEDELVPPEWSMALCQTLKARRIPTECYMYTNYDHNFYGAAEDLFIGRMLDFFKNY